MTLRSLLVVLMVLGLAASVEAQPVANLEFRVGNVTGPFTVTPGGTLVVDALFTGDPLLEFTYAGGLLDPSSGISILDIEVLSPFVGGPLAFSGFAATPQGPDVLFASVTLGFDPSFTGGTLGVIQSPGDPTHGLQGPNCFDTYTVTPAAFVIPSPGTAALLGLSGLALPFGRRRR